MYLNSIRPLHSSMLQTIRLRASRSLKARIQYKKYNSFHSLSYRYNSEIPNLNTLTATVASSPLNHDIPPQELRKLLIEGSKKVNLNPMFELLVKSSSLNLIPNLKIVMDFEESVLSTRTNIMLLKALRTHTHDDCSSLSIKIFYSLMDDHAEGKISLSQNEIEQVCQTFLQCISRSNNIINLLTLKNSYHNYISVFSHNTLLEISYLSAFIHISFNASNFQGGIEIFESSFLSVTNPEIEGTHDPITALTYLPTKRFLDLLCSHQDWNRLLTWLEKIDNISGDFITPKDWLKFLSFGLNIANYNLVKTVYDHFIMKGFDKGITRHDILFDPSITNSVTKENRIIKLINDEIIFQILHIFALEGDVGLTLRLIESHYVHKTLKGERALTLELCIQIIAAYCYYRSASLYQSGEDEDMIRVLKVLNGFVVKLKTKNNAQELISYRDITAHMSHRFLEYKVKDINVERASQKIKRIEQSIKDLEENLINPDVILPRKIKNDNVYVHSLGNILANLTILESFINKHINLMIDEKFDVDTVKLFINCILNHINLRQNSSGMIKALLTLKTLNYKVASEWLNKDLFEIILYSISNSTASKLTSLKLYQFFKSQSWSLSHHQYIALITASLRGDKFNDLLEYYVYEYLRDYDGVFDGYLLSILNDMGVQSPRFESLKEFLQKVHEENLNPSSIDAGNKKFPNEYTFNTKEPIEIIDDGSSLAKREYNHKHDIIDAYNLKYVLSI